MKIFAIMLVKNEVDIVGYVLKEAEKWADKIFILDNGSTDGTWELIQSMKNDVITPWKQYFGDYHNGLRADVYNEFKHLSKPGDWWCYKCDADEVYAEDPREFLAKIPKKYQWVGKQSLDYVITNEDLAEYNFTGDFGKDRKILKYFRVPCWSEGRFFRYRKGLTWTNDKKNHYPEHIGVQAPDLILVHHYLNRSPEQIKKRIEVRMNTKMFKEGSSWGTYQADWKSAILNRDGLEYFDDNLDRIKKLPVNKGNFKQSFLKNTVKRILISLRLYK